MEVKYHLYFIIIVDEFQLNVNLRIDHRLNGLKMEDG